MTILSLKILLRHIYGKQIFLPDLGRLIIISQLGIYNRAYWSESLWTVTFGTISDTEFTYEASFVKYIKEGSILCQEYF